MRSSTVLAGLATVLAPLASAHTVLTTVFVNDKNQGDGTGIRMPLDGSTSTSPIINMNSNDMICGRDGLKKVSYTIPATAGSKMSFEFRAYADGSKPGFIDDSHQGPVSVYAKSVSDFDQNPGGSGWFKIWHDGYDEATKKWAVQKIIDTNGILSISLPEGMPTGAYLLRTEVIAMQNVTTISEGNWVVEPQFYVNCAQVYLQGSSSGQLSIPKDKEASIPGHVHPSDKGLHFNMYDMEGSLPYVIPGPKLFRPSISGAANAKAALTIPTEFPGAVPDNCILKNANWCGFEVPSYTNEDGCWAATDNCWAQSNKCFADAPPSGQKGCHVWEKEKCQVLQDSCFAKQFTGPPNKGKVWGDVTVKTSVTVPGVMKGADLADDDAVPEAVDNNTNNNVVKPVDNTNVHIPAATTFITSSSVPSKSVTTIPAAATETRSVSCGRGDKKQKRRMHINRHKRADF
ncbi:glycosyl hydrolase family 61-domain-containing protein [Pseudoneurospora amorphoporcata]|uniref:lytic cellulose monooxygenase (C4-dehydrogenating) n=1 Tax=Pseudoneurospora amorphoporcata TaxID=241081 RepID=A0AAN6SJA3_9PEZI|nr:glycosyl hydrolase family 61-domain-containing protein [Pseudoneurospora amorphoporcata]